jgi:origin recognition complex subunit 1
MQPFDYPMLYNLGFDKVLLSKQLRITVYLSGYTVPTVTESLGICARLGSCRLLLTEHSRIDVHQRVLLNVSSDDIYYALKV